MISPEKMPHIPQVETTPERVLLKEVGGKEEVSEKKKPTSQEIKERVIELFDLSASRPGVLRRVQEAWGGLTTQERDDLKAKGEEAIIAHFNSLKADSEMREFTESTLAETDARIRELASNPDVLRKYKDRFKILTETLASVLVFERLQKELRVAESREQKWRTFYEQPGQSPGPIEHKKLKESENKITEIRKKLQTLEFDEAAVDMLRRREIRDTQRDLAQYNFAETETRTELIREVLPDLLQGAPILFQGETGSGKTQLAKYIAHKYLGHKVVPISIHEQVKESQLMGRTTLKDGATEFIYSEFIKGMKEGKPIILDEINLMPHEFQGIFNELLQLRVGDSWIHPTTGEKIELKRGFAIMATANLKSERYKQRYELDIATLRRFIGGAGAREIHHLDLGKKDKDGGYIAPETLKILATVLADRHGNIDWNETEAPQKADELRRFVVACRKIQEDFTEMIRLSASEQDSFVLSGRYAFQDLAITLKDQIEIMKAWKSGGFREPLQQIILREFFHKAEISGRPTRDRENMVRIFIGNKFFLNTKPEDFKIFGLAAESLRQWQGKK